MNSEFWDLISWHNHMHALSKQLSFLKLSTSGLISRLCLLSLCVVFSLSLTHTVTKKQNKTKTRKHAPFPTCTSPPALSTGAFKLWMAASCQSMKAVGKVISERRRRDSEETGREKIKGVNRCSTQCFSPSEGNRGMARSLPQLIIYHIWWIPP